MEEAIRYMTGNHGAIMGMNPKFFANHAYLAKKLVVILKGLARLFPTSVKKATFISQPLKYDMYHKVHLINSDITISE